MNGNVLIRRNILRVAFLSGDGRRSVLGRLKVGTLGELFDGYYIRAVNYFWRSCREFLLIRSVGDRRSGLNGGT